MDDGDAEERKLSQAEAWVHLLFIVSLWLELWGELKLFILDSV